ncbi:hypothetical protein NDA11_003259 [Ustilago hordei]|uniref:Histone-lysine N-methyltransferase, H3 lysine-4 specific n=1 Tax=Ustilago hordei TaxID=120017 RepID=I2G161_USTHO|nr:uncharacterized protein UHO2_03339 [Ustilago hordei]KAJ1040999.1 hypothetical protein NDA10_000837 [Ustilago hordei]KAJ1581217.1 hypothetical protein NDA15_006895 [Ustilago hordei]KAJ1582873.1 hypothetical protein NDA12_004674 [Ustilago hordei]KAJ1588647.1 hypothetical protein NDA11_003259 [Ustilago hordei]KAJ1599860.1 hypothetical protein NDA14_003832 [Ustilago hordei]
MPSYAPESSYDAASSSRYLEHASSHSRSSRSDPRRQDLHRRTRSPYEGHRHAKLDRERHRPPERRYDDDEDDGRHHSHHSSRSHRYPEHPDHSRHLGSAAYSSSSRDRREEAYSRRDSGAFERHGTSTYGSPEPSTSSRPHRSPDSSHGWDADSRGRCSPGWDKRYGSSRRYEEERDVRRSWDHDSPHRRHGEWRNEPSPDRPTSAYKVREPDRSRHRSQHGRDQNPHDRRESRRHASSRSRSRSRSRERLPATHRSSQSSRLVREGRSEHVNGVKNDHKLLKRKDASDAPTQQLHGEPRRAIIDTRNRWDGEEEGELKQPTTTSVRSHDGKHDSTKTLSDITDDSRYRHAKDSVAESHRPSRLNGHAADPSPSDRPHERSKDRLESRSPSTRASATSSQLASSDASTKMAASSTIPTASGQPSTASKLTKRSFDHVLLPHELPVELRGKNSLVITPYKKEVKSILKSAVEKDVVDAKTKDPRSSVKKTQHYRDELHRAKFVWDADSVGQKPPPAPRNLVLTNLSALMQPAHVLMQIRPFGRIEDSKLEMHPRIGQSLGIFRVTFAHDFDEQGKVLGNMPSGQTPQHGAKAAKAAQASLNGRQMGQTRVSTFLDREGEVLAEKVKEKIAADEAKSRPPVPPATPIAVSASSAPATPGATKPHMPPPNIPRGPRSSLVPAPSPPFSAHSPSARTSTSTSTDRHDQTSSSSASRYSRYGAEPDETRKSNSASAYDHRRDSNDYDSSRSRPYSSRPSDWSARPSSPSRDEPAKKRRPKIPTAEIIETLRKSQLPYAFIPKPKACDIAAEVVEANMNGPKLRWLREGDTGWYAAFETAQDARTCRFLNETISVANYTLQVEIRSPPSKTPHPSEQQKPVSSGVAPPHGVVRTAGPAGVPLRKALDVGLRPLTLEEKSKLEWAPVDLKEAVFRMLQKELVDVFVRDVKNRVVAPHLTAYLKPDNEGGQILAKAVVKKPPVLSKAVDHVPKVSRAEGDARLPSFRKTASVKSKKKFSDADDVSSKTKPDRAAAKRNRDATGRSKSQRVKDMASTDDESEDDGRDLAASKRHDSRSKSKSAAKRRGAAAWLLSSSDEEAETEDGATMVDDTSRSVSASVEPASVEQQDEDLGAKSNKKTKAKLEAATKKKGTAAAKKSAKTAPMLAELELDAVMDAQLDDSEETAWPETEIPSKAIKAAKTKPAKVPIKAKPLPEDPFDAGLVEDVEDLYYLRMALGRLHNGEPITEDVWPDEAELEAEAEEAAIAAGAPPKHQTGSARTEGMYRIPPEHKAAHLPDRNKATEEVDSSSNAHVLQSARNNRADSRRLVLGIEQHKRETATDTDIFKFNQLRTRKKQLKFAKSPIHDWGLYAMEYIPAGDMVIEYVGEMVRQQVADNREKQYERQGNFSTYLFRVDDDLVVDATHKGNIARLMNHCCTPNCNAKILTVNGEKRIVLFAKSPIKAGEELTYDYKFQSSADDEDAIPCLCGSDGCRRYL